MKRSLSLKFIVLTFTLLVGSLAVTATERPFSLNGTGIAIPIVDGNGNVVGAEPTGSGNATHLGRFTNTGHVDFTPDASNPTILHPSGGGVFTAANGDKLNFVIVTGALDLTTGIGTGDFDSLAEPAASPMPPGARRVSSNRMSSPALMNSPSWGISITKIDREDCVFASSFASLRGKRSFTQRRKGRRKGAKSDLGPPDLIFC